MMASSKGLHLDQVSIRLGARLLLAVDTTVPPGTVLSVMGPSGSGKSTLLAAIAGLLAPAFTLRGGIRIDDVDLLALPPEDRHAGLLFQDPLLFPHLSVRGNLLFGMPPGEGRAADPQAADPATLSGGQKARVALLRVLLSQPRAMLLDEPFSALDTALRQEIRQITFDAIRRANLPCILVTHDRADADAAGGPVIALAG